MTDTLKALDDLGELLDQLAGNAREFDFHATNRMERDAAKALLVIEAALTPPAAVEDGWQPIETAPRDGTRVRILSADGAEEDNVYWSEERYCILGAPQGSRGPGWVSTEAGNLPIDPPTHWQPLPRPPATQHEDTP